MSDQIISSLDISNILSLIPHRYPLLLVDKVIDYKENEFITALKNVTYNEPQFTGHFPDNPVMPGVLIIEAMAQASAILVAKTIEARGDEKLIYLMSISEAKFRRVVRPGDTMIIKAYLEQSRINAWKFKSEVFVDDNIVAEGKFTAMVKDK